MSKPVLGNVSAFDATIGTTINFSSGDQIYGSFIKIYSKSNLRTPIQVLSRNTSMLYSYTISPSDLNSSLIKNEDFYYMSVVTIIEDASTKLQIESEESNKQLFWCHTAPAFKMSIETVDGTVYNVNQSSLGVSMTYTTTPSKDAQGNNTTEALDSFYINFYEGTKNASNKKYLGTSGEQYGRKIETFVYTVDGLENQKFYCFKAFGTTMHGMKIETEYIPIYTSFQIYQTSMMLALENDYCNGVIKGNSYLNFIKYDLEDENVVYYTDPNSNDISVDLRKNSLTYYDGVRIGENYSLYTRVDDLTPNETFLTMTSEYDEVQEKYHTITFKYMAYPVHVQDENNEAIFNIIGYKPYFTIIIDDYAQVLNTDYFKMDTLTNVSANRYEIKFNKIGRIIDVRIAYMPN